MKTGARFFLLAGGFAFVIATTYWFITYEPAGTALLGSLALAPAIVVGYILRHARGAPGPEDRPDARPPEGAGQTLGPFPSMSAWPAVAAAGALLVAGGIAYGSWLLIVGGIIFVAGLVGLARE